MTTNNIGLDNVWIGGPMNNGSSNYSSVSTAYSLADALK